jgi:hypothetical protein
LHFKAKNGKSEFGDLFENQGKRIARRRKTYKCMKTQAGFQALLQ